MEDGITLLMTIIIDSKTTSAFMTQNKNLRLWPIASRQFRTIQLSLPRSTINFARNFPFCSHNYRLTLNNLEWPSEITYSLS